VFWSLELSVKKLFLPFFVIGMLSAVLAEFCNFKLFDRFPFLGSGGPIVYILAIFALHLHYVFFLFCCHYKDELRITN